MDEFDLVDFLLMRIGVQAATDALRRSRNPSPAYNAGLSDGYYGRSQRSNDPEYVEGYTYGSSAREQLRLA